MNSCETQCINLMDKYLIRLTEFKKHFEKKKKMIILRKFLKIYLIQLIGPTQVWQGK